MAVCIALFEKLYKVLRKKEPARQDDDQFLFQNVQHEVFEILKMFNDNIKFTKTAC